MRLLPQVGDKAVDLLLKPVSQDNVERTVPQAPELNVGTSPLDDIRLD